MNDNPYESTPTVDELAFGPMLARTAVAVFACGLIGAVGGGGLGAALGKIAPGYYRAVFGTAGQATTFEPVEVGVGLGATQGTAAGCVVGVALVFLWYRHMRLRRQASQ